MSKTIAAIFFDFNCFDYLITRCNSSSVVPERWSIGYRILVGAIMGMMFTALCNYFASLIEDQRIKKIKADIVANRLRLDAHAPQ